MLSRLVGRRDAGLSEAANKMLNFFRLHHLAEELAGVLSYGQQKLLDVAMAFMAGPRRALLDEPAGGVNPTTLAGLCDRLKAINAEEGATFVVIEHNWISSWPCAATSWCCPRAASLPREIRRTCAAIPKWSRPILATDDILRLEEVVAGYGKETILNGLSFAVPRAVITTVIGPNGAGKSTAFKATFGMLPVSPTGCRAS
jgi:ABC-type branched-subunit amino acid transport system ATPase component